MVLISPLTQTYSTLLVFLLAMVLYPEVQAKAQADIDRVIGKDRLPDFDDRPALPYLDAILRETLRWHPTVPLGPYTMPLCVSFISWISQSHIQQRPVTFTKVILSPKVFVLLIYRETLMTKIIRYYCDGEHMASPHQVYNKSFQMMNL